MAAPKPFKPTTKADKYNGTTGNDSILGDAGNDTLSGGTGNDYIDGGKDNDLLSGENGNDTLLGSDGKDTLNGGSGDDKLDGGKDNDKLTGDAGNDTLNGGAGADSMNGGDGSDYYYVDNIKDSVVESNKNATTGGNDTVESLLQKYTLPTNVENLLLAGADLSNGTGNKLDNTITGNIADNNLNGDAGNDKLNGGAGVDTLDGGLGMDTLTGGEDSDFYFMNNTEDTIVEEEGGGDLDQVNATVSFSLSTIPNVEAIELSGAKATDGTGNELNNLIQEKEGGTVANNLSGAEGDDTLNGVGGDDTLEGGTGNDLLDGGDGEDTAIYNDLQKNYQITPNVDADGVAQLTIKYVGDGDDEGEDILNNIEVIQFSDGTTLNAVDILNGGDGTTDSGSSGDDSGSSGSGNDTVSGGSGNTDSSNKNPVAVNDSYKDIIAGTAIKKPVSDLLKNDTDADGNKLSVTDVSNATGGTVSLDASKTNVTFTPTDASSLTGSFQYSISDGWGGTASATVTVNFVKPPETTDAFELAAITPASTITFWEIPLTDGADAPNLDAFPSHSILKMLALAGNDSIRGGSTSTRWVDGGDGDDFIAGGDSTSDTLLGGAGNDYLCGGKSDNSIDWKYDGIYDGSRNTLSGGAGDDSLCGGYSSDLLIGGDGNDVIAGGGTYISDINYYYYGGGNGNSSDGNDILLGGNGNDHLYGYGGNDTLTGDAGVDNLDGGSGADSLTGGADVDRLSGGSGADTFVFSKGDSGVGAGNRDVISDFDFSVAGEVIDLSAIAGGKLNFVGLQAFGAINQVRYELDFATSATIVKLNLDNDPKTTEMEIELTGFKNLTADDFVLVKPV